MGSRLTRLPALALGLGLGVNLFGSGTLVSETKALEPAEPNWNAIDNSVENRSAAHASRLLSLLIKAAERGAVKSQTCLGDMYRTGVGARQDPAEAAKWYRMAAEAGEAEAMYELGNLYRKGLGVEQVAVAAAKWYREAARLGYAKAQSIYGYMCVRGEGVPLDYSIATQWLTRAAAQGSAAAMHNLGLMRRHGIGGPVDLVEAYMWFTLAIPLLMVEPRLTTIRVRSEVAQTTTAEQIEEALARVRDWRGW